MATGKRPPVSVAGFSLLGILFLVAGLGVGMAALGSVWHTVSQREKEQELLFAGDEYRRAITSFWTASPDKDAQRLPKSIEELLEDPRFPNTVRHLRRPYADPITNTSEWGLVLGTDGGITGVHSLSTKVPIKSGNFPLEDAAFEDAKTYQDWVFVFEAATEPGDQAAEPGKRAILRPQAALPQPGPATP